MTSSWHALADRLGAALTLDRPAVAVTFCAEIPTGVRRFLGEVPSSCSFWSLAAGAPAGRSAFYTLPADHHGCPIGSYTHNIELPAERAHELPDVLGVMAGLGYLSMAEVPGIPRWAAAPAAVVYARLAEAPLPPDVVILAARPRAAMLLAECARAAGGALPATLPRPTCMAIPAAAAAGAAMSFGCVGNRVYTEVADDALYCMVRGAELAAIVDALPTIASANVALAGYHQGRKAALTRPETVDAV